MSRPPDDEPVSIEAGLERAWREVSRDEPPAALDDAIRAAARKAVHAGPHPAGVAPFGGRWRVPLSVAAVLVVSATITLLVAERDKHGSLAVHDQAAPAPAVAPTEPPASPDAIAKREVARSTEKPAPPPSSSSTLQREQARETAGAAQLEHKTIDSGAPASMTGSERGQAPLQAQQAERPTQQVRSMATAEARQDKAQPVAGAPAAMSSAPGAGDRLRDAAPAAAVEPAAAAAKAQARGAVSARESVAEEARLAQPRQKEAPATAPPRAEPSAFPAAPAAAALPEGDAAADGQSLEPKAWLERILELRRAGKLEEADKSLEAFRERYPDHPLPSALTGPR